MTTHEFLGIYDAKVMEYLLAVCYLLLFVPMWRYVQAGHRVEARAGAAAGALGGQVLQAGRDPVEQTRRRADVIVPIGQAIHADRDLGIVLGQMRRPRAGQPRAVGGDAQAQPVGAQRRPNVAQRRPQQRLTAQPA